MLLCCIQILHASYSQLQFYTSTPGASSDEWIRHLQDIKGQSEANWDVHAVSRHGTVSISSSTQSIREGGEPKLFFLKLAKGLCVIILKEEEYGTSTKRIHGLG